MSASYTLRVAAAVLDAAPGITNAHFAQIGETRQDLVAGLRQLANDFEEGVCHCRPNPEAAAGPSRGASDVGA